MGTKKTLYTGLLLCSITFCLNFLSLSHAARGIETLSLEKKIETKTVTNNEIKKNAGTVIMTSFGKQPLFFIQNDGQLDEKVKYYEKGPNHATFFTEDGIYLSLSRQQKIPDQLSLSMEELSHTIQSDHLKLSFVDANIAPRLTAESPLKTRVNYYIGNDPDKWQPGIPTYSTVRYKEVYKNIDIKVYGNNRQLEYDIVVKPGGDPKVVKFKYEGANSLMINEQGELEIGLNHGTLIQRVPYLYQEVDGKRIEVSGNFKLLSDNSYTFEIDSYDKEKQLIIDPIIEYSRYLGGDWQDIGNAIAIDSTGNAYITGYTYSYYFPDISHPHDVVTYKYDAYVYKAYPNGTMAYVTVFGGTATDWITGAVREAGNDIAVDSSGNAHVTGSTMSVDFPTTTNAFQSNLGGHQIQTKSDAFYTVLDSSGNISYSTYLGGANIELGYAIAVDTFGNACIAGSTAPHFWNIAEDFPVVNALQPTYGGGIDINNSYFPSDGFIAKFHFDAANPSNTSIVFSTYLGGDDNDSIKGIAVDNTGNIYVTGSTRSPDFPAASTSTIQATSGGGTDAFITKINAAGTAIVYSTYLGGNRSDYGIAIDVDSVGAAYITGYIYQSVTGYIFPLVNPIQAETNGGDEVFVTKINAAGSSIDYSTFLGGENTDWGLDIAVDSNGTAYITGYTSSAGFPIFNPINGHGTLLGSSDGFIVRLTPSGSGFLYSTFFGGPGSADTAYGIAADNNGNAWITGITNSSCLPAPELVDGVPRCVGGYNGYQDGYIAKIYDSSPIPPEVISVSPAEGKVDVAVDAVITVTFSKNMNSTSFDGNFYLLQDMALISGTISFNGSDTAIFTPSTPMANDTTYSAVLSIDIEASDGVNLLTDYTWQFTTAPLPPDITPPTILSTDPLTSNDTGEPTTQDVAIDTIVTVTFSEDMDPTTITTSSFYLTRFDPVDYSEIVIPGTISFDSADFIATFTPDNNLPYSADINLIVKNTVTDLADNPLDSEDPWGQTTYYGSFKTECDPLGPIVLSSSPLWGTVDVPVDTTISFTFDQDFDPATVDQNTFELWPSDWSIKIPGSTSYDVATKTLSFTPDTLLENSSSYYGIVASYNFFTLDGRILCSTPFVLFTTIAAGDDPCSPDVTPPTLSPPADTTVESSGPGGTAVTLGTPIISDTCDADPLVTNDAPALFSVGTTIVTWTVIDASGNSSSAIQKVVCTLASPFTDQPPRIDGKFDFGEWINASQNQINLQNGFVRVTNDKTRLYILIDLTADDGDDVQIPRDFFNLTIDVDKNGEITPDTDINYTLYPDVANIRYRYYTGPDTFSDWQGETFSSMAMGFDCFADDGSLTIELTSPPTVTCNRHRIWEIAIDLAEINAAPGDTLSLGLQVASPVPAFIENFPIAFFNDFSNLIPIQLSAPALADAFPGGDVMLENDAIEITQAIQNRQNSLPLVQDKDTAARVYVHGVPPAGPRHCLVSLFAKKGTEDLPGSPLTTYHLAPSAINRELLNDTANFKLPAAWTREDVTFYAVARSLSPGTMRDDSLPIDLTFTQKEIPLYWNIQLNTGTVDVPELETSEAMSELESYLKTVYPVADVNIVRKPWQEIGVLTGDAFDAISDLNDYYSMIFMGWLYGAVATGESPFDLPDQVFGTTIIPMIFQGMSDPTWWNSSALGVSAWGTISFGSREAIMAHEINHNLDRVPVEPDPNDPSRSIAGTWGRHVGNPNFRADPDWGCGASGPDPNWPWTDSQIHEIGFDTRFPWIKNDGTRITIVPSSFPDYMSYCFAENNMYPTQWISPYRWQQLFDNFTTIAPLSSKGDEAPIDFSQINDVYYISGTLNVDGTGTLKPVVTGPGDLFYPEILDGQYALRFLDAQENILRESSFHISFVDVEGQEIDLISFNFRMPLFTGIPATASIVLTKDDQVLDTIIVSDNPPEVTLNTPNGGEAWNVTGTITWTATDLDNDLLTFSLFYSPDGTAVWIPIARNLQGSSYNVDTAFIPGGSTARVRIIATDGFHTAIDDSATFTVAQNPPRVYIETPHDGDLVLSGRQIAFCGDAADNEDTTLPDETFVWFFNGQSMGQGRCINASLPVGLHEIALRVTDSQGSGDEAVITIEVRDGSYSLADFDTDTDVDGKDLTTFASRLSTGTAGMTIEAFAAEFGK